MGYYMKLGIFLIIKKPFKWMVQVEIHLLPLAILSASLR